MEVSGRLRTWPASGGSVRRRACSPRSGGLDWRKSSLAVGTFSQGAGSMTGSSSSSPVPRRAKCSMVVREDVTAIGRGCGLCGACATYGDAAATSVIEATADRSWRVREMAAKVIGTHAIDDGLDALSRLVDDPVPRVRGAAASARVALTNAASASPRGYPAPRSNRERTDRGPAPTAHPSRRPGCP